MICFSLFLDNGDTFQFGIPLKVYKCIFKNISASIILILCQCVPIAATLHYYFRILHSDRPTK